MNRDDEIDYKSIVEWRRNFHRYPEVGWTEFRTTVTLVTLLREMGLLVHVGTKVINPSFVMGRDTKLVESAIESVKKTLSLDQQKILDEMQGYTGCVAVYDTGRPGKTVALRFDIDCLSVSENKSNDHYPVKQGFVSERDGFMHACGHDGHMSVGLGVAKWLAEYGEKSGLSGVVKLLFQPSEEGVRGAKPMAESGIMDDAQYFLGMHLGFIAKTKEIVVNPNNFLCTKKYDFRFFGVPAHAGAEPHVGVNALSGACNAATQMLGIPRHGKGMSRINVGVIRAGTSRNVIPAFGELQIEVRGETEEINTYMANQAERIAQGVALGHNLRLESELMGEAVDLNNDQEMVDMLSSLVNQDSSLINVPSRSFGGSEDATILAKRCQSNGGKSLFFVVGSNLAGGHHQSNFDFDESSLLIATKLFIASLLTLCESNK
ncbi:hypothetical protein CYY_005766 [Polysphondylium violaceum]|uniref:Peptidase M20 dimerisation domain-containing protein n=1 Tax=Polysphondylium violaceum TaxID=133409 RepID=A0A8J4PVS0_9MYCE|nr:hypothetical protein CYY_005766 [Polysphondylium violaceum]